MALFYAARGGDFIQSNLNLLATKPILFLCGRDLTRLQETQKQCQDLGAMAFIYEFDVKNQTKCQEIILGILESYGLDLLVANAGISAGTLGGCEGVEQVKEIFAVNFDGVVNTIDPAISWVTGKSKSQQNAQKTHSQNLTNSSNPSLQIAIISSLAGFRGLPSSPAYCASKAAVRVLGEALRGNLGKYGIAVNVVCPGYVKTPMTAVNKFFMPGIIGVEKAAEKIALGLSMNKARIAFPCFLYFLILFVSFLPLCITDPILRRLPGKKKLDARLG